MPPADQLHQSSEKDEQCYGDAYVQALFDRMGPTYDLVNLVSSFGFSEFWRRQCVVNAQLQPGSRVCDMMAGSGECWPYTLRRGASVVSVDFSAVMIQRQRQRKERCGDIVEVLAENALQTSIPDNSIDCVVSAFGLKTLDEEKLGRFAKEIYRILKPGGYFSLLEISTAEGWWLSPVYRFYLDTIIPLIGKVCLGDIECYRMLGRYTKDFQSCHRVAPCFGRAGLEVSAQSHFYGCATSLVGKKV